MSILKDYQEYTDRHGLVQPESNPGTSGNGVLFTAQYVAALDHHGALSDTEKHRLRKVYQACERKAGLLFRAPPGDWDGVQQGPDDHYGAMYADMMLGTGFCKRWLKRGREGVSEYEIRDRDPSFWTRVLWNTLTVFGLIKAKFVFNNENENIFNLSAWMARFPQMLAIAKIVAGEKPSILEWLFAYGSVIASAQAKRGNQDAVVLQWLKLKVMAPKSWIMRQLEKYWKRKVLKNYPEGIGEVLGDYFHPAGDNHPSAKWLRNVI